MPVRLVPSTQPISIRKFSVVGQYQNGTKFVRHVALARDAGEVSNSQPVTVWQMGPPLVLGPQSRQANENADMLDHIDLVGFIQGEASSSKILN